MQFPARRAKVRRYAGSDPPTLKQQTLTQIDFVSSFEEDDVVALSDTDDDVKGAEDGSEDKENVNPGVANCHVGTKASEEDDDDEQPVLKGRKRAAPSARGGEKRRRTMGDDDTDHLVESKRENKSRRRTLGHVPASSNYHTQTLTQFLGHQTSFIADSDDDDDDLDKDQGPGDDGFLSWLGEPGSPSAGRGRRDFSSPAMKQRHDAAAAAKDTALSREDSVIPQTPAKRTTTIRFEMPLGGMQSPSQRMIDRYGAPGQQESPVRKVCSPANPRGATAGASRQPELVIEDSYATQDWTTPSKSQARLSQQATPTPVRFASTTPSKFNPAGDHSTPTKTRYSKNKTPSPKKVTLGGVYEIPDSDDDEEDELCPEDDKAEATPRGVKAEEAYGVGAETQLVLSEVASTEEQQDTTAPCSTQAPASLATAKPNPAPCKPLRKPLHHPSSHTQAQSQLWESQRVPVSILRSLPTPSARSDILLPLPTTALESLVTGRTLHVTAPFKIPSQVVRFWLFEKHLLRYMASVEAGQQIQQPSSSSSQGEWHFHASQVYELNNPVCENDMREEGWLNGQVTRYTYLPPAVVGQLLWNLQHALFADPSEQEPPSSPPGSREPALPGATPPGSLTLSQQVTAQIHSDMVASSTQFPTSDGPLPPTPDFHEPLKLPSTMTTTTTATTAPSKQSMLLPRPSQATTASQQSTPEKHTQQPGMPPPPPIFSTSQSSIHFIEGGSLSSLPLPSSLGSASQLLTKSQMLSDSLLRDHAPPEEPEIWDSDEEEVPL
jgi:hypothetical protein